MSTRRKFLKQVATTAATIAAPMIIPGRALGLNGHLAPSERITMGFIGLGGMGTADLKGFLQKKDAHILAVCDVDSKHLYEARDLVNLKYGNSDCMVFKDFRALLLRKEIDAVCIALPDQWHGVAGVMACRAGKDVYSEKPLAYNVYEGRAIVSAVARYGTVWQTGSQQRSEQNFRFGCELVRNGYIGSVKTVKVGLPYGNSIREGDTRPSKPPDDFDYDMWLGPAPYAEYCEARCHWNFRWNSDYGGGQLTDWAGHHIDIAQWGMNTELSAPAEIEGAGTWPRATEGLFDTMEGYRFVCTYREGFTMIVADSKQHPMGVRFEGSDGWIYVDRGKIDAYPKSLLRVTIKPEEIHLYKSDDHRQDLLNCIRSRQDPIAPAAVAHHSIMVAHLGLAAIKRGRKLQWDNEAERFTNDPEANRLLSRPMRSPWHIE